jgi:serine/threonine-protein kinase HipA
MRRAQIYVNGIKAAELIENARNSYELNYDPAYSGAPISLKFPVTKKNFKFDQFPTFFEGLLPEGMMLETLLRTKKIDQTDYLSQILVVGMDLVGHVTVREI